MPSAAFPFLIALNALYSTVTCRLAAANSPSFSAELLPLCTDGGEPLKSINGTVYSIYCGSDYSGGEHWDLEVSLQKSLEDCLIECSNYNRQKARGSEDTCKGVVLTDEFTCHLKTTFENQVSAFGRNSAFVFDTAPAGTNCLQDDRKLFRENKYNDEYQVLCRTEIRKGIVFDTFNGTYLTDCMTRCSEISRGDKNGPCLGVTLQNGICTLRGGDYIKSDTSPYARDSAVFTKRDYTTQ